MYVSFVSHQPLGGVREKKDKRNSIISHTTSSDMSSLLVGSRYRNSAVRLVNICVKVEGAFRDRQNPEEWLLSKKIVERYKHMPINKVLLNRYTINSSLKQFTAYRLYFADPSFSALLFENGSIMIVGVKDKDRIIDCVMESLQNMADAIKTDIALYKVKTVNIVTSFNLFPIDFRKFQEYLKINNNPFIYNPLTFPGLFIRVLVPKHLLKTKKICQFYDKTEDMSQYRLLTVLIFHRGKTVTLGTQSEQDWIIAFEMLFALLINFTASDGSSDPTMNEEQRLNLQNKFDLPLLDWFSENQRFMLGNNMQQQEQQRQQPQQDDDISEKIWSKLESSSSSNNKHHHRKLDRQCQQVQHNHQTLQIQKNKIAINQNNLRQLGILKRLTAEMKMCRGSIFSSKLLGGGGRGGDMAVYCRGTSSSSSKFKMSSSSSDDDAAASTIQIFNHRVVPSRCSTLSNLLLKPNVEDLYILTFSPPINWREGLVVINTTTKFCCSDTLVEFELCRQSTRLELLNHVKPTTNLYKFKIRDQVYSSLYKPIEEEVSNYKWVLISSSSKNNDDDDHLFELENFTNKRKNGKAEEVLTLYPNWYIHNKCVFKKNEGDSVLQEHVHPLPNNVQCMSTKLTPVYPASNKFLLKRSTATLCEECNRKWNDLKKILW